MKALITGISGFVGFHLSELLLKEGYSVAGTVHSELEIGNRDAQLHRGDLLDEKFVKKTVSSVKPDLVFHLASLTNPVASFEDPAGTILNNVGITINILEAVKEINARTLIVSSAHVYGLVKEDENPIKEDNPLRPESPYAVSKLTQDFLGLQYHLAYKMPIVRVRPSNQIGPGQRPDLVVSSFAKQIAEAESGKREPVIKVGNLEAIRDFIDVRDIVHAYVLAILQGKGGEVYNLGSGKGLRISEILDKLVKLSKIKLKIEEEQARLRPVDTPKMVIDTSKFRKLTNWKPEITIDESLQDILNWWRKEIHG